MKELGVSASFDAANTNLKILILRAAVHARYEEDLKLKDPMYAEFERLLWQQYISAAIAIVDWCWDQRMVNRSEAYNIKHWLHWFNDPVWFNNWECWKDFRYE